MMEGIENVNLSLQPVEEEDWPLNPHLDEDPNGWSPAPACACQLSEEMKHEIAMCSGDIV